MIKLNAGFSRKMGEPNYGSRGASVNVELEVESGLISDPNALADRIRRLFELARRSVDIELGAGAEASGSRNVNGNGTNGRKRDGRCATASQLRAIRAICKDAGLDALDEARRRYGVDDLGHLTVPEASEFIDDLKASSGRGGR